MAEKRYFWMKLKVNFMTSDTVDYLMSQQDGANYVVLYQMLCLKTINTDGLLCRTLGNVVVPFDIPKIQRECKWFSEETIKRGLDLFLELGLLQKCVTPGVTSSVTSALQSPLHNALQGVLQITDHKTLIGSESESAERVRRFRDKKCTKMVDLPLHGNAECNRSVTLEIENRDRYINTINTDAIRILERGENQTNSADDADWNSIVQKIRTAWNQTGLTEIRWFRRDSTRGNNLVLLLNDFGMETILEAIERAGRSEFLKSAKAKIGFDWFLTPSNFQKVLEGNYDERWVSDDNLGGTDGTGGAEAGRGGKGAGSGGYDGLSISERIERKREAAKRKWGGLGDTLD